VQPRWQRYWLWSFLVGEALGVIYAVLALADGAGDLGYGAFMLFAVLWTLASGFVAGWVVVIYIAVCAIRTGLRRARHFANPSY
jgi:hypothetical protein